MSFLQKQLEYTTEMEQEYRSVRKWNHDMENHLFSLNYLIRAKKYHEADAYLETILSELPPEKRTLSADAQRMAVCVNLSAVCRVGALCAVIE